MTQRQMLVLSSMLRETEDPALQMKTASRWLALMARDMGGQNTVSIQFELNTLALALELWSEWATAEILSRNPNPVSRVVVWIKRKSIMGRFLSAFASTIACGLALGVGFEAVMHFLVVILVARHGSGV